mgnify:FL=1|tara:strand:- start:425 stop:1117 length:693 start_codon:yes stop_codon:yes gene_type:complete
MFHVIIYARISSSRLRKKALVKLSNKSRLIDQVINQAKKITSLNKIVLATTRNKEDIILCNIAKKHKINYFRGSENNLIKRTYDCCKKFNIKYFLRYCGDRPIVDIKKIKKCFKDIKTKKKPFDLMTTNYGDTKVDEGFTIEIFNTIFFKNIIRTKISRDNKEHLGNYIYQNSKQYKIVKIKTSSAFKKGNKYTIDDKYDLNRMNFIFRYYNNHNIKNVIALYSKYERFS